MDVGVLARHSSPRRRASPRPAHRRPASARRPDRRVTPQRSRRRPLDGYRLLVIEDHRDSRELLRQILEGAGAEVELADNGRTGLAALDAHRPHVILCDLLMPEMDGLAFAQHVKVNPKWTRIPILAVTALGGAADYIRTWSHGFTGHLTKPIDASRLIAAVRRVARR